MCGIVGYIGGREAAPIMIAGLKRLEYRGYDSAGIALHQGEIRVIKTKGRLDSLETQVSNQNNVGTIGIGHTRWATHGKPSDANSHPHTGCDNRFAAVHNGIIENYQELIQELKSRGHSFSSETDTEVIPHLLEEYWQGDLLAAVRQVVGRLEGSYALGVMCRDNPEEIIVVRQDSPLVLGVGENENYIASDIPAILEYTRQIVILEDGQLARVTRKNLTVFDADGNQVEKAPTTIDWDAEAVEKGGYPHFMLKEIMEQPAALRNTISQYLSADDSIDFPDVRLTAEDLAGVEKIFVVACGTAYHAGLMAKYLLERMLRIPVENDLASEFRYRDPVLDSRHLVLVISQSGETADTLAALREAKRRGAKALAITNVVGSSIAREADNVIFTAAGPEIAVASTKAYSTQLVALALFACYLSRELDRNWQQFQPLLKALRELPNVADSFLTHSSKELAELADSGREWHDAFFIGRGLDWAVAQEGSLKLKEISYIHAEAYAAGELKHGTLALVEEGTPVIGLATQSDLLDKTISNIKETKARGALVIGISQYPERMREASDILIQLPKLPDPLMPIISVIPTQLLAYYAAVVRDRDVDKPRNLAKSVTVE
ncbi:MAG: glutamine--fructose-6-phosphate transaminase (isomerizing) [Firmicutes bacterium]|nr:glutamine--fructose-6-phosphate transaminase (isomerizing) [Bacillota bacterium]